MSTVNRSLVTGALEAFSKGDIDAMDGLRTAGYKIHLGEQTFSSREIKERNRELLGAFSDIRTTVVQTVSEGDLLAYQHTVTGTHTGEFMGVPATGKRLTWTRMVISRFDGGKIAEEWAVANLAAVMRQAAEAAGAEA